MSSNRHDSILILNVGVSIFGLFTMLLLAFNPPVIRENFFWRKPLVGLVFSIICIFGIFAALFPKLCSRVFYSRRGSMNFHSHKINATSHHPDCREFSAHVLHINGHTLCAACTGLLFGAFMALIGTVFYFFGGWRVEEMSFPMILIGAVGVALGFIQFKFRGLVRLILNTSFVLGVFLILIGIDELTESLFVDLFLVAFVVFWILARIQISQWDHCRICSSCKSPCEVRGIKRK